MSGRWEGLNICNRIRRAVDRALALNALMQITRAHIQFVQNSVLWLKAVLSVADDVVKSVLRVLKSKKKHGTCLLD